MHSKCMAYMQPLLEFKTRPRFGSVCWSLSTIQSVQTDKEIKMDVYAIDDRSWFKVLTLSGNTKGGRITVLLTSCLAGLESAV